MRVSASAIYTLGGAPVAPLPVNNTKRYWYDYDQSGFTHTLEVRGSTGSTDATADAAVATILGDIGGLFVASVITAARKAAAGSNLSFPFTSARVGDNFGSGASNVTANPRQVSFVGRSPGGRRVRFSIFGFASNLVDYRLTTAESAAVLACVNHLNALGTDFVAIDGQTATWLGYANIGLNDYWLRQSRAG